MSPEILAALRASFPEEALGKLPKITCTDCASKDRECSKHKKTSCQTCKNYITTKHIHIDYVGHAHVRERLNDVDPAWNWEPLALDQNGLPVFDGNGGLWIRLTVGGKSMLGYGDAPGKRGGNAIKEAIGDAFRNAGQSFGIAAYLWKKEGVALPLEDTEPQEKAPVLTEPQKANLLRGQLKVVAKSRGQSVEQLTEAFVLWSRGEDIIKADSETLQKFQAHFIAAAGAS